MTRDEICNAFIDAVPYELYPVQEEALLAWFECEGGVMVCAPTGMGKTLIAEAAVFEALHTRQVLYYTTPLIALTEQKYRDLQHKAEEWGFSALDVGFITGNRRENPDALIRVVVAEILLNHLLARDPGNAASGTTEVGDFSNVAAVVMDEFHNFNDYERGVVWELSLTLLPPETRVMLLSATVGNPFDFADWLKKKHSRKVQVVTSNERRVPLEFGWVGEQLMTEFLPSMYSSDDGANRTPTLVFCFNRDECWDLAEKLKGLQLIPKSLRPEIEQVLDEYRDDLAEGAGPKLKQMLIRGVGVHHAGILPLHKSVVEKLFLAKLVPFVICTETLAAGINLPARSAVVTTLLKGKPGERKLIPPSSAHQMFGRAGRPQFDTQGYVFAVAHDDDVKIAKWQKKFEQIDTGSKDPVMLRKKRELERKKPSRRSTEQYWSEKQFKQLIEAGPAKLVSRGMMPYNVLIWLLTTHGSLNEAREFLDKRFTGVAQIEKFQAQLGYMLDNLAALGYLTRSEDGDHVALDDSIHRLLNYRSVDPLYGEFLAEELIAGSVNEKLMVLESVLESPWNIVKKVRLPRDMEKGPLQSEVLEPQLRAMGVKLDWPEPDEEEEFDPWATDEFPERPPTFPEMLKILFDSRVPAPEDFTVQPKWIAGDAFQFEGEFFKMVKARDLVKQEGLILRHILRLVILAEEFFVRTEDPQYQEIGQQATQTCHRVDPTYTDRFLAEAHNMREVMK